MTKRRYTLKHRAEQQARTRARIVEAAIALHEELGPRNATISAIAERAGVQRLTVYRHFASDAALFSACTSTWLQRNPPPEAAEDGEALDAVRETLRRFYAYYRSTADMWTAAYRDVDEVDALREPMQQFEAHITETANALLRVLKPRGRRRTRVRAALRHGLAFSTWRSLCVQDLDDDAAAALAGDWIAAS